MGDEKRHNQESLTSEQIQKMLLVNAFLDRVQQELTQAHQQEKKGLKTDIQKAKRQTIVAFTVLATITLGPQAGAAVLAGVALSKAVSAKPQKVSTEVADSPLPTPGVNRVVNPVRSGPPTELNTGEANTTGSRL